MSERNLRVFVPQSVEMRAICSLQYFAVLVIVSNCRSAEEIL